MIVKEKIQIPSPSDFIVSIDSIIDDDENKVDLANNYIRFIFYDNTGASYECVHDPIDGNSKNTTFDNGTITMYIENYHLKSGELRYRIEVKNKEYNYPDGGNSVYTSLRLSGIILV